MRGRGWNRTTSILAYEASEFPLLYSAMLPDIKASEQGYLYKVCPSGEI